MRPNACLVDALCYFPCNDHAVSSLSRMAPGGEGQNFL